MVPTRLGVSAISGIGLFAVEDIPAGTVVWRNSLESQQHIDVARVEWFAKKHPHYHAFIMKYAFLRRIGGMSYYVLCLDNTRFMNHSENANITEDPATLDSAANRLIHAGEEITCDYREFDAELAGESALTFEDEDHMRTEKEPAKPTTGS